MALPLVPGVVKTTLTWKVGSDTSAQNVLHFRYTGGATGADLAAGATTIAAGLAGLAALAAVMGTHVTLESITLTDLASMAEPHGEADIGLVGTETGEPLPSGSAVLMNFLIARRYRGGKPRAYLPFGTALDLNASNKFISASLTNFLDAYGNLNTTITDDSGPVGITNQCNVGYFSGYTLGPAQPGGFRKKIPTPLGAPHNDLITGFVPSQNVGSQRRRNRS